MMMIRNDDVAFDTAPEHFRRFCRICDDFGFPLLQCITPLGAIRSVSSRMTNDQIRALAPNTGFVSNREVLRFLRARGDLIAVHGLWHTHQPPAGEIARAAMLLKALGLEPTHFVPPFNEGSYPKKVAGLKVIQKVQRLEDYLEAGLPTDPVVYLHSWRFDGSYYRLEDLRQCLARISATPS